MKEIMRDSREYIGFTVDISDDSGEQYTFAGVKKPYRVVIQASKWLLLSCDEVELQYTSLTLLLRLTLADKFHWFQLVILYTYLDLLTKKLTASSFEYFWHSNSTQ